MEVSCGTDIIEIKRIKESIESLGEKFLNKVYTQKEIEYCESRRNQKYQHYAGRFAAKEAIFKAISKKLENKYDITWTDIEVLNDEQGRPFVNIDGKKQENMDISISHCREYAIAMITIIWNQCGSGEVKNETI